MNKRVEIFGLVVFAVVVFTGAAVFANDSAQDGPWESASTWVGGTPGSDPVIKAGHTVTLTSSTSANSVTVEDAPSGDPGVLSLEGNALLTVQTSVTVEDSQAVAGVFRFSGSGGSSPELRASHEDNVPVTLDGPITVDRGAVMSRTGGTRFHLLSGCVITVDGASVGSLAITSPIENDGVIRSVERNTTITGLIADDSSGLFEVSGDSIMVLTTSSTITGGADFLVTDGQLSFSANVTTNGGVKIESVSSSDPKVTAAQGVTFEATGDF